MAKQEARARSWDLKATIIADLDVEVEAVKVRVLVGASGIDVRVKRETRGNGWKDKMKLELEVEVEADVGEDEDERKQCRGFFVGSYTRLSVLWIGSAESRPAGEESPSTPPTMQVH